MTHLRVVGVVALLLALAGCSGSADDDRSLADRSSTASRTPASVSPVATEAFPAPSQARLDAALVGDLQSILDNAVAGGDSPGLAAAISSAEGVWAGSAGRGADGRRFTAQTPSPSRASPRRSQRLR